MKKFEEWLKNRDPELCEGWKDIAQSAALAGAMMMPGSADASPRKPTPQGKAAVQKFYDTYEQAKKNPIVINQDGSMVITTFGRNINEAKSRAMTIFMTHMNDKFAKTGLEYKKNAFIHNDDQQVDVLVSQPLPDKKGFVFQVKVKVNSYRKQKDGLPIPLK